ncbi:hypothetical protein QUF74_03310 [Candidatus Halobeggiatoa sp. HSG11]|nr:hypothetical protein [Candidatus Halobeggiatoa sp. HSG11]
MNIILKAQWWILVATIVIGCATPVNKPIPPVNNESDNVTKQLKLLDNNDPRAGVFFKSDSFGSIRIK